jgi:hypothetical protein
MRRFPWGRLAILLPLLSAACFDGSGGPAPLPTQQIEVIFPPHGIADQIMIDATDRLPLRVAELVAPDGTKTMADAIDISPSSPLGGMAPTPFPSFGGANELNLPNPVAGANRSEGRLLITISKATIRVPDMVAYRRDWRKYRIRLEFGRPPGASQTHVIEAPQPPQ